MKRRIKHIKQWTAFSSSDATLSNFPSLKHFFPCEDGAGTYGLRDVVGGVVYSPNAWTAPNGFSIRPAHTSELDYHNLPLTSGSWSDLSAGSVLVFAVVKANAGWSIGIGSSLTYKEITLSSGILMAAMHYSQPVNVAILDPNAPTSSIDSTVPSVVGCSSVPSGNFSAYYTDATGANQTAGASAAITVPDFTDSGSIGGGNTLLELYGYAVFCFASGLPSDLTNGLEWMRAEWARGRKAIYPGWIGKT